MNPWQLIGWLLVALLALWALSWIVALLLVAWTEIRWWWRDRRRKKR